MMIDAITVCVGEMYCKQLQRALPIWGSTLDSLTIITKPNDPITQVKLPTNTRVHETDIFTQYKAHFNKGAALCEGFAIADPSDWVLHVDSDIIPPPNWRDVVENTAKFGCLSGAFRYDEETGECLDEAPLYPYGYFHLWSMRDAHCHVWPLFEPWFPHAGSYDANFTDRWPKNCRKDLGFKLIHQGERRQNWFGPGADPAHMKQLHVQGLRSVRMLANRTGIGRLKVPQPKVRAVIRSRDIDFVLRVLRVCRSGGPFMVEAKMTNTWVPHKYMEIMNDGDLAALEKRVQEAVQ